MEARKRPRAPTPQRAAVSWSTLVGALLLVSPLRSAQTTAADPAGSCNGLSSCFTTIAAAVASAGPPPATVLVFPGSYPESVDLGSMGSGLMGGAAGDLTLVSVDAAGQPSPGAFVDPSLPGGPGSGSALYADGFPGDLMVYGLRLRSPDGDALLLQTVASNVTLRRIDASDSPVGNGVSVTGSSGALRLEQSTARRNGSSGFVLLSGLGSITVSSCIAERNTVRGFFLSSKQVDVAGGTALANDAAGFSLLPTDAQAQAALTAVTAQGNGSGIDVGFLAVPPTQFVTATLQSIDATANPGGGILVQASAITATDVVANGNGGGGGAVVLTGSTVHAQQVDADGNQGAGIVLAGSQTSASQLTATSSSDVGILVTSNGSASSFELTDVEASNNGGSGVVAFPLQMGETLVSGTFTGLEVASNGAPGLLAFVDQLVVSDLTSTDNQGGVSLIAHEVDVSRCQMAQNLSGLLVSAQEVRIDQCVALKNGPASAGTLDGSGFALVDVDHALITNSAANANVVGWTVLDQNPAPLVHPTSAIGKLTALFASKRHEQAVSQDLEQRLAGRSLRRHRANLTSPRRASLSPTQDLRLLHTRSVNNGLASMQVALRDDGLLTVRCSNLLGNGPTGLELQTDQLIDAQRNYWGSASGPFHPANPGGSGDVVRDAQAGGAGTIDYSTFLAQAAGPECIATPVQEVPTLDTVGRAALILLLAMLGLVGIGGGACWRR